jgi:hypothetical protein
MPKKPRAKKRLRRRRAPAVAPASAGREVPRAKRKVVAKTAGLTVSELAKLDDLRRELERTNASSPLRWNADPDDAQRSVAQLVLTLVEFIRKLLERQAIRRMEAGTLTDQQTEDIGRALMQLEETVVDMAARFGVLPEELNLDLGPIGKLM